MTVQTITRSYTDRRGVLKIEFFLVVVLGMLSCGGLCQNESIILEQYQLRGKQIDFQSLVKEDSLQRWTIWTDAATVISRKHMEIPCKSRSKLENHNNPATVPG